MNITTNVKRRNSVKICNELFFLSIEISFSLATPINSMENRCFHCEATFASESLLNEHLKSVHRSSISPSSSVPFKCLYCHTSFTSRAQLERHARIHVASSGTNLKCNICDRQFPTIDLLSEHKLSHCKATTSNLCSVCQQKIENEEDYIRHFYDHHQGNSPTKSKGKLFNVHQTDSTPITIACVICKQSLINEREIDLHAKFHLTKSKLKMNCSRCHRTSINDGNFLLDLSTWNSVCFQCLAKELNLAGKTKENFLLLLLRSKFSSRCLSTIDRGVFLVSKMSKRSSIRRCQNFPTTFHIASFEFSV